MSSPRPFSVLSQPVLWYLLIDEAERFSERTGLGLASVWEHVHQERYAEARQALDQAIAAERGTPPVSEDPVSRE